MSDIPSYFPSYYDNIKEINVLKDVESLIFDTAYKVFEKVYKNQFVVTSDEEGIVKFETLLGIIANPSTETLQFRIDRVINRLNQNPPYTIQFLKLLLDDLLGKNQYNIYVDNYTLYLESSFKDQSWFEEIIITINAIKPCNIVFINKPLITEYINISEEVLYSETLYARLGTFRLGSYPFIRSSDKEVVKLPTTKSIQNNLLNKLSVTTKDLVASVLINDTLKINEFIKKDVEDGNLSIEYNVITQKGIEAINNIKLLDAEEKVLSSVNLYIPLVDDIIISHTIRIKEGV